MILPRFYTHSLNSYGKTSVLTCHVGTPHGVISKRVSITDWLLWECQLLTQHAKHGDHGQTAVGEFLLLELVIPLRIRSLGKGAQAQWVVTNVPHFESFFELWSVPCNITPVS